MGKAQREEWQSVGDWVDQRRCPGLGEEAGSEVECYVGARAFILLARGILGEPAEPPLLKKLTDFMLVLHLNSFPVFFRKTKSFAISRRRKQENVLLVSQYEQR